MAHSSQMQMNSKATEHTEVEYGMHEMANPYLATHPGSSSDNVVWCQSICSLQMKTSHLTEHTGRQIRVKRSRLHCKLINKENIKSV